MYIHHTALNTPHDGNFILEQKYGLKDYLFLYAKSPSTFIIADSVFTIQTPSVFLIAPDTYYRYFPTGDSYIDDYLHFAPESPADFLSKLTFPLNTPVPISNDTSISKLLSMIFDEYMERNKYTEQTAELLITLLMYRVSEQWDLLKTHTQNLNHYQELLAIRQIIVNHPERSFSIPELAKHAHLSNAYFQVLYKKAFDTTCLNDVISSKITHAKTLLTSTDMSVNEIASELSYTEPCHFIRQFKKNTGMTPGAFRKRIHIRNYSEPH